MAQTRMKAVVAAMNRFPERVTLQRDGLMMLAFMVYKVLSKTPPICLADIHCSCTCRGDVHVLQLPGSVRMASKLA